MAESRECEHTTGRADHELYLLTTRAVAEKDLGSRSDQVMCARCMIQLAAEQGLSPERDFVTKEAREQHERLQQQKLEAYAQLVKWVGEQKLLPDVDGGPPRLGRQFFCRKCAGLFAAEDLWIFDNRFLDSLHPDLMETSENPGTRLQKRSLCDDDFKAVQVFIDDIAKDFNDPIRWNEGRTHLRLSSLFKNVRDRRT